MPLLETIRQQTDSPWVKLIFGAVLLVFIFWGVGNTGAQTVEMANVNGTRITDTELNRAMRGYDLSGMNEDQVKGMQKQALDELIRVEVMLQEAKELGIEVSDKEIARQLLQIEAFKDANGKFSEELYSRALKRMGLTQGKFEEQLRRDLTIQKLGSIAAESVTITDAELERLYRLQETQVQVAWVRIPDAALLSTVPVEESAIDAYLAASVAEVQAAYDKDRERLYHKPRGAETRMILLRGDIDGSDQIQKRIDDLRDQARGGADFADLARRYSEDLSAKEGGGLGLMTEGQLEAPAIEAIFKAGEGGITDAVTSPRGLAIYQVLRLQQEQTTPFEEVKRQIARDLLANQQIATVAAKFGDDLLAAWKAQGKPPQDLLDKHQLTLQTAGPVSQGSPQLPGAGSSPELIAAISAARQAGVLGGVYATEGGRIVAEVTTITEPDMASFAQRKDQLKMMLLRQKQEQFLAAWLDDLVARAKVERNPLL